MLETFNTWLAAWGEERGFGPIRLDEAGFAAVEDDARLIISLYLSPERGVLKTIADLGQPPSGENAADFHAWLLVQNFGASVEREGILARAGETGHILFVLEWPMGENASAELLNVFLQQASLQGNLWRERIAAASGGEEEEETLLEDPWQEAESVATAASAPPLAAIPAHYLAV
ncbi:MAG: CesT family type III secretion system chaperone [Zoogloeaceae bacterium]|nr:CesT family type III secretion system chaperone [Zoogloeaceae bacterium]